MGPSAPDLVITAPNGVAWRRQPGGSSSAEEFLTALAVLTDSAGRIAREWDWWEEGREAREHERIRGVIRQWDHAEPPPGGYLDRPGKFGGPYLPNTVMLPVRPAGYSGFPRILSGEYTRRQSGAGRCCTRRPIPWWRR
jgi:hypothetical protein